MTPSYVSSRFCAISVLILFTSPFEIKEGRNSKFRDFMYTVLKETMQVINETEETGAD